MFKRILVPLDTSARAERAVPVAARIARASGGCSVLLLRVVGIPMEYGPYLTQAPTFTQEILDSELDEAQEYLSTIASSLDLAGIETKTLVIPGAAALKLLSVTTEQHADLVVMCSHGDTGVRRWVLGSVAQKIVRHSSVPVLVLREGGTMPLSDRPLRVLVALDGSALAKATIEPAANLAAALSAPARGELHLTRVVKVSSADMEHQDQTTLKEQVLHKAKTYLSAVSDHLRDRGSSIAPLHLNVTWSVVADIDVATALIKAGEVGEDGKDASDGCDVIAIATHGRGGLQRWAMGSVTERVLGVTRLPLLVVRPKEADVTKAEHAGITGDLY